MRFSLPCQEKSSCLTAKAPDKTSLVLPGASIFPAISQNIRVLFSSPVSLKPTHSHRFTEWSPTRSRYLMIIR